MCGISGFIDFRKNTSETILKHMTRSMDHRGPDGEGFYFQEQASYQLGLGHKRLSIIDLSNAGTQPMHYNHYSILLNGEVYNYAEIRKELEPLGHTFVSHSDTEVVLHAYMEWGVSFLDKLVGMFSIVIHDPIRNVLFCVRDRAGVKPFYYYWKDGLFLFTSELKAFHHHPRFDKKVNASAVAGFLQYGYVPAPYAIFEHTFKLLPGHYLEIDLSKQSIRTETYWDVLNAYEKPKLDLSFEEAKTETETILEKAFAYRMVADVPVGIFLSGGYDSSCVTALLQKNSSQKLKTFTIGVGDAQLNEAPFAKQISTHLGTEHTEYYCTEKDVLNLIEQLPFYYDEPFGDSSAMPTMLVSALARKQVTVALSADAGDEIFAGYNRYDYVQKYVTKIQRIPKPMRAMAGATMDVLPVHKLSPDPLMAYRYRKIKEIIKNPNADALMHILTSEFYFDEVQQMLTSPIQPLETFHQNRLQHHRQTDEISRMMATDYITYLPDDILQKVDRATMSVSLEGREPFLDQHIIEWAAQIPTSFKYHQGTKKHILKEIVHQYIPKEMMDRPKMGFAIPISKWLKEDLSALLEEHLNKTSIEKYGLLQYKEVEKMLNLFKRGKLEFTVKLWYILMLQMWCKKWL